MTGHSAQAVHVVDEVIERRGRHPTDVLHGTSVADEQPSGLPDDPAAAAEEIQRRRDELGFSYFVFGAEVSDSLAPVVAELAGT
jgi:hypothetical protein